MGTKIKKNIRYFYNPKLVFLMSILGILTYEIFNIHFLVIVISIYIGLIFDLLNKK